MGDRVIGDDCQAVPARFADGAGLACSATHEQHIRILQIFAAAPGGQTKFHTVGEVERNHAGALDQLDESPSKLDPGDWSDGYPRDPNLPRGHARSQVPLSQEFSQEFYQGGLIVLGYPAGEEVDFYSCSGQSAG